MHHTSYSTSVNFFQDQTKKRQYHTEQVGVEWDCTCKGEDSCVAFSGGKRMPNVE